MSALSCNVSYSPDSGHQAVKLRCRLSASIEPKGCLVDYVSIANRQAEIKPTEWHSIGHFPIGC